MRNIVEHIIFAVVAIGMIVGAGMLGYKCDQHAQAGCERLEGAQYN